MKFSCCFIGHRKIIVTEKLINRLTEFIEKLIVKKNVKYFLFGSKSEFNNLCHKIVTNLKTKYPNIIRVACPIKSEASFFENEKQQFENYLKKFANKKITIYACDKVLNFKESSTAGKLSYIKRNQSLIDNSDYCIFYYDKSYKLYNSNSGTKLAYNYAKKQEKQIFNFFSSIK